MSRTIQDQVNKTYFSLRWASAILGFAFPIALVFGGYLAGFGVRDSMSAYYHAYSHQGGPSSLSAGGCPCAKLEPTQLNTVSEAGTLRNEFVGLLFAIGAVLYVNKGHTNKENILLNVAGGCAWGIALFPTPWKCGPEGPVTMHGAFAFAFFAAIACILLFCSKDTVNCLPVDKRPYYFRWYYSLAAVLISSPVSAVVINDLLPQGKSWLFAFELVGIYAFSIFWIVKTREIKQIQRYQSVVKVPRAAHAVRPGEPSEAAVPQTEFF